MKSKKNWPEKLPISLRQKSTMELDRMLNSYWRKTGLHPNMGWKKVQEKFLNFHSNAYPKAKKTKIKKVNVIPKKKKFKPLLYNCSRLIDKLCIENDSNHWVKTHNSIIAECIKKITSLYEDARKPLIDRMHQIDFLISQRRLSDAKTLHSQQLEALKDFSSEFINDAPKHEEELKILRFFAKKHKDLGAQIKDGLESSVMLNFKNLANEKCTEFIRSLEVMVTESKNDNIIHYFGSINFKEMLEKVSFSNLFEEYMREKVLIIVNQDFLKIMRKSIRHLEVRVDGSDALAVYKRAHQRQSREINRPSLKVTGKLPWRILPTGDSLAEIQHLLNQELALGNIDEREMRESKIRMEKILELSPMKIYKGIDSFSDYFALIFDRSKKVVFESIKYGNAIYIVEGNWISASKRTKKELREDLNAKLIIHKGNWFGKLKNWLSN